ncbi:MAG: lysophospholipid acyltransferase family protein, partial [Ilumatobacteraceae bacterium]
MVVPPKKPTTGPDFETDFARKAPARAARVAIVEGPMRAMVKVLADPTVDGLDRLEDLRRQDEPPPLIFTPNHHSHLDTPLMITCIPEPWRHKLIVAAAADYFFTSRATGTAAAIALNALPIDRETTSRRSSEQIKKLIEDGWSLLIYPEGGRSPDGWGQGFKAGPAYLSSRTGAPIVPVFIEGSGSIFGKGMKRPKPGRTRVTFGRPIHPDDAESTKRYAARVERAVTQLGDESLTDWYTARRRAAAG